MYLTTENAHFYVGKILRSSLRNGKGLFHHYPLKVILNNNGKYIYCDNTGTCMPVPEEKDHSNSVYFDIVENEVK